MPSATTAKVLCTLCSCTFNVARTRTLDEPESAAYCWGGPEVAPCAEHQLWPCSTRETGCLFYFRNLGLNSSIFKEGHAPRVDVYFFCDWTKSRLPQEGDWLPFDPKTKPKYRMLRVHLEDVEHVSGPGCQFSGAYSGNRISVAEMQGCQTVQCLVPKPDDWEPAADDQDFEQDSTHFLSGFHNGVFARSDRLPANPIRHGAESIGVRCPAIDEFDVDEDEIPFHPWCFGIWMRLTRLKLGYVAVDDLVNFFRDRDTQLFQPIADHFGSVNRDWVHKWGEEWLAANPFYVPQLRTFLEEAMDVSPSFTPHDSVFRVLSTAPSRRDLFARLPPEVRSMVLQYLASPDIASLRAASRTFHQLPASLWYRLLRDEMPWLWEIWSTDPPYFWATVTEQELQDHGLWKTLVDSSQYTEVYDKPTHLVSSHTIDIEEHLKPWTLPQPPRGRTNWLILYRNIKRSWRDLKGLRNRKRIWEFQTQLLALMNAV